MSRFKLRLYVGVSALMAASALAAAANAQQILQGGGSTLLAPYGVQAAGCFESTSENSSYTASGNTYSVANGSFIKEGAPGTISTPATPTGVTCAANTGNYVIAYDATGSGAGQLGLFAHDDPTSLFGTAPGSSATGPAVFAGGSVSGIQFAFSDNALGDSDLGVYNVGTNQSYTAPDGTMLTTAANYQGFTFAASGANYTIPVSNFGQLVQAPVSIDPVAISYNPTYKSGFSLHLPAGHSVLILDKAAYCGIFNGTIKDWGDSHLASINGWTGSNTLKDPSDTGAAPITLIGRSDGSGTSSILSRHLGAVCGTTGNNYADGTTNIVPIFDTVSTNTGIAVAFGNGSGGVASAINSTDGSIGYIGPDYVLPAVLNTGTNSFNLPAALVINQNDTGAGAVQANATTALAAFGTISPPSSAADQADPTKWVQSPLHTAQLANPSTGYPIVGTSNFLGYTCYATVNSVNALRTYLTYVYSADGATILNNAGLGAMPSAWVTAINNAFLNTSNPSGVLYLAEAGSGDDGLGNFDTNSACTASGVVGG